MTRLGTVRQVILRTADLQKLNEPQRRLLLTLGHAANEMAALYRAAYAAAMDEHRDADTITQQIARAQTLLMLRMAASKMLELIKITDEDQEYRKIIQDSYPGFDADRKWSRKIVAKHITLDTLRNDFGFHYCKKIYSDIDKIYLNSLPGEEIHDYVFERKSTNSFFAMSEFFFQKAFAAAMKKNPSYEEFAKTTILELVPDIMVALDKLITAVHRVIIGLWGSVGIDLRAPERHNESAASFTPKSEARLPALILFDQDAPC